MPRTHILHRAEKELMNTEDSPIWKQSLSDAHQETKTLDKQFQHALLELRGRQRKFVLHYATGDMTEEEACVKAGYSKANAHFQKKVLLRNEHVAHALSLAHTAFSLKHGISSRWKRQKLINLYEICADPEHEKFNATAAVKAMQLMTAMDGDVASSPGQSGNAGVSIQITTGVPSPKVIIESGGDKPHSIVDVEPEE